MGTAAAQPSLRTVLYYTNYCSGFSSKLFPFVYQTQKKKGRVLYASAPQQRVLLHLRREEKGMWLLFRSLFLSKATSVEYFFKLYLIYFYWFFILQFFNIILYYLKFSVYLYGVILYLFTYINKLYSLI